MVWPWYSNAVQFVLLVSKVRFWTSSNLHSLKVCPSRAAPQLNWLMRGIFLPKVQNVMLLIFELYEVSVCLASSLSRYMDFRFSGRQVSYSLCSTIHSILKVHWASCRVKKHLPIPLSPHAVRHLTWKEGFSVWNPSSGGLFWCLLKLLFTLNSSISPLSM